MKYFWILALAVCSLMIFPLVYASSVTRSIDPDPVDTGAVVTVDLDVVITGDDEYYAIDDNYSTSFSIYNDGGGDSSHAGHLKWVVCGVCGEEPPGDPPGCIIYNSSGGPEWCTCCLETVGGTTYTYQLQAPSTPGTYDWSGIYMFENMSDEQDILGEDQVTVQEVCVPSTEICDGSDNDCNDQTDEGCDDDNDDYCDQGMTRASPYFCSGGNYCCPLGGGDCDDDDPAINPGATEICDNEDNNCDNRKDYITTLGDITRPCGTDVGKCVAGTEQCIDGQWVNCDATGPDYEEDCNLGLIRAAALPDEDADDDCNGIIDDVAPPALCHCTGGVDPLSDEQCPLNGIDDDCNALTDEDTCDCEPFNDTHLCEKQDGVCADSSITCPAGGVWPSPYCNDSIYLNHDSRYESGTETTCDGHDNDCDGSVDEGLTTTYYRDFDGDTYGDPVTTANACSQPAGYVTNEEDCNDTDANINPGETEVCTPPLETPRDENCDGNVDFLVIPGDLGCVGPISVTADYYDGRTTNFTAVADFQNIPSMILEKSIYGMMEFLQVVNISFSTNLNPPFTEISQNKASINSTRLPFLSLPAKIHLYNLTFLNPVVLRNNQPCSSSICQIINYTNDGNLTFNVTGFSVYSATGSCSDGTLYGECSTTKPRYCLNGVLVNRASTCGCPSGYKVSGENCVKISTDGDGGGNGNGNGGGGPVCTEGQNITCHKQGVCEPSYQICTSGFWGPCEGPAPQPEVCDNKDNDCDGEVDEGITCLCKAGEFRSCGPANDTGVCKFGISTCINGAYDVCEGAVYPSPELCDEKDNDCDGEVDEECATGLCPDGPIPAEGCLCDSETRNSGYCCSGVFYEDGCPLELWSILILIGVIILIALYGFLYATKGGEKTPEVRESEYA